MASVTEADQPGDADPFAAWREMRERQHLLFRDYLRSSGAARESYAAARREAARLWVDQRGAYTEAKSDVILGLLDQAEAWAPATGWTLAGDS
jgi:GrpB-like predicted nucleotidyltransferase (UPF0157 family)